MTYCKPDCKLCPLVEEATLWSEIADSTAFKLEITRAQYFELTRLFDKHPGCNYWIIRRGSWDLAVYDDDTAHGYIGELYVPYWKKGFM